MGKRISNGRELLNAKRPVTAKFAVEGSQPLRLYAHPTERAVKYDNIHSLKAQTFREAKKRSGGYPDGVA
jgi:hypothetical protein